MKSYKPVSAYVSVGAGEVSSAFYTVPVGRIAKLTYAYFSYITTDRKSCVKVDDNSLGYTNAIFSNINDLGSIAYGTTLYKPNTHQLSERDIYLNAGSSLYLYSTVAESVFISLIEEYEA